MENNTLNDIQRSVRDSLHSINHLQPSFARYRYVCMLWVANSSESVLSTLQPRIRVCCSSSDKHRLQFHRPQSKQFAKYSEQPNLSITINRVVTNNWDAHRWLCAFNPCEFQLTIQTHKYTQNHKDTHTYLLTSGIGRNWLTKIDKDKLLKLK